MKVRELISLLLEKPQDDEVTAEVIIHHYVDEGSAGTVKTVDAPVTDVLPGSWPVQLKCCVDVNIVSKVEVW